MPFTSPPAKSVRIKVIAPVIAVPIEDIMPVTTPIIALPAPDISPGMALMPFTMAIGARPIMVNTWNMCCPNALNAPDNVGT